jgi:hypothetical protein
MRDGLHPLSVHHRDNATTNVLGMRNRLQVLRIHAGVIPTEVIEVQ